MRYPTEVNLIGDAKATLTEPISMVHRKQDRSWRERIEKNVARWWDTVERQSMLEADPVNPDRPAIALVGDGAMQMNGLAELLTVVRYHREWSDPRLVVCVFHNNDLNQVTWELRGMGGAPKFEESQSLSEVSYADLARTIGIAAITVRHPEELADAWEQTLSASGPMLLDVLCDPEAPPIPPHATFEQMKSTAAAVLRGDPESRLVDPKVGIRTVSAIPGESVPIKARNP